MAVSQKVRARRARLQPAPPVRAKATLVYSPHPLLVDAGRVIAHTAAVEGESLAQYLRRHGVDTAGPLVVTVNAREVARDEWELLPAEAGQLVTARGAAANDGGSNPLRLVALIALAVAAPWAGGYIASSMFGGAVLGGTMGSAGLALATSVAAGVVTVAGSMLLNRLFPPPKMDLGRGMSEPKASPTYSIAGGQNRARPYEPIPLVLGTHRVFFDLAAKPYTVFEGEDQYLYQVFCVGMVGPHGALDVSDLRIGETPLASYAEVTTQTSVGTLPAMMPANVDTVAGGELSFSGGALVRTTSSNTTRIEIDLTAVAFEARNDGTLGPFEILFYAEYRAAGSADAWQPLTHGSTTGNKTAPVRLTYGVSVAAGAYEVRITRTSPDAPNDRVTADLHWAALKSYQPDDGYYEGQQFLAVKIRATGQLQGVIDRLSGIVRMPTAPGVYSSSPADLFRLFAIGHKAADGRALWGGQLSSSALDTAGLLAWSDWCAAKGLAFNGVIDTQRSVWDVLQGISRCGRAAPTWAPGKLGVVWDADSQPVVASFGMSNIRRGSFEVAYQSEDPVDEVVLSYIDADSNYQPDQVRAIAPGVTVPSKSASIELWGCTNRAQAVKECFLALAENLYRTRLVSWETDMEGLVVTRGDVVSLSHDLTQWGTSGRLVAGTANDITIDRPITVISGSTWVGIISPDGEQYVCRVGNAGGQHSTLTLIDPLPVAPDAGNPVDWRYTADYLATPGKLVKIVSVVPTGMHSVKLQAVDEYDEYYAAESGVYTPPTRRPWLSSQPQIRALGVTEEVVRSGDSYVTRLAITWSESGDVASRLVRYAIDGGPLTVAGYADGARYSLIVPDAGTVLIVVTLYDGAGQTSSAAQSSVSHTLAGVAYAPLALVSLTTASELFQIRLSWVFAGDINDVKHVEVWGGSINSRNSATLLTTMAAPSNGWLHTGLQAGDMRFYWARVIDSRNRPSDWFPSSMSNGVPGAVSSDPSAILDALRGNITEDELYLDLSARINLIDGFGEGSVNYRIQDEALARAAAVEEEADARAAAVAAEASARVAAIAAEALARGTAITTEATARQAEDEALAQSITTLSATVGDNLAALEDDLSAVVGDLAAETAARTTLAAQMRGDYAGSDLTAITSGLLYQERIARATAVQGLAQQITLLSAGAGEQFDYKKIWYFDADAEGWTGNGTPTISGGWLRPANHATDPYVVSPVGVGADGAQYTQVRLRIRKTGSPVWAGQIWWRTAADSTWDAARRLSVSEPTYDGAGVGLIIANLEWSGVIDRLRIDLSDAQSAGTAFEIDWVAIGRPSPGASSAALQDESVARANADSAEATARQNLSIKLTGVADPASATLGTLASGLLYDERQARATADSSEVSARQSLAAKITGFTDPTGKALADLSSGLIAEEKIARATQDTALATSISSLSARVGNAESAITAEQTARSSADSTEVTARQALSTKLTGLSNPASATLGTLASGLLYDERQARATADSSEVSARQSLAAKITGFTDPAGKALADLSSGLIAEEKTARATADGALSTQISTVSATAAAKNRTYRQAVAPTSGMVGGDLWFDSDDNNKAYRYSGSAWVATDDARIAANTAAIVSEQTARANGDTALAQSITTLSTTVNGHTTSIQTAATSISGIQAKYTVKIDNNGYVSGYGLISSANNGTPLSAFTILADKFAVVTPGRVAKTPFVVGTVNGVTAVGIDGALAVDGSIAARSIDTKGLTVKDANGNIILSSGVPLDWSRVGGRPDDTELLNTSNPLNKNPDLLGSVNADTTAPRWSRVVSGAPTEARIAVGDFGLPIKRDSSPVFYAKMPSGATTGRVYWVSEVFDIDETKDHCLSIWARKYGSTGAPMVYYRIRCYDRNNVDLGTISLWSGNTTALSTQTFKQYYKTINAADFPSLNGEHTAKVRIEWYGDYATSTTPGTGCGSMATRLMLNEGRVPTKNMGIQEVDIDAHLTRSGTSVAATDLLASWNKISTTNAANFFNLDGLPGTYITNLKVDKLAAGALGVNQWISSTNYVTGASGWAINANGSAEFRDVVVRGDIEATSLKTGVAMVDALNLKGSSLIIPVRVSHAAKSYDLPYSQGVWQKQAVFSYTLAVSNGGLFKFNISAAFSILNQIGHSNLPDVTTKRVRIYDNENLLGTLISTTSNSEIIGITISGDKFYTLGAGTRTITLQMEALMADGSARVSCTSGHVTIQSFQIGSSSA